MKKIENYRRKIVMGIILISLGITFTNIFNTSIGIVFIALGGLFIIIGIRKMN